MSEVDDARRKVRVRPRGVKAEVAVIGDEDARFGSRAFEDLKIGLTALDSRDIVTRFGQQGEACEGDVLVEEESRHAAGGRTGTTISSCRTSAA